MINVPILSNKYMNIIMAPYIFTFERWIVVWVHDYYFVSILWREGADLTKSSSTYVGLLKSVYRHNIENKLLCPILSYKAPTPRTHFFSLSLPLSLSLSLLS